MGRSYLRALEHVEFTHDVEHCLLFAATVLQYMMMATMTVAVQIQSVITTAAQKEWSRTYPHENLRKLLAKSGDYQVEEDDLA